MAGPWEKYAAPTPAPAAEQAGPWAKYAAPAKPGTSADIPLAPGAAERMAAEEARRIPAPEDNLFGKIIAPFETVAAIGTGMVGGLVGAARGGPFGIPFSNAKDAKEMEDEGAKLAESMTYQPRTQTGRQMVESIGKGLHDSGIIGIPIPELNMLGRGMASSGRAVSGLADANAGAMAAQDASAVVGATKLRDLVAQRRAAMAGVGAAESDAAKMRMQTAANLPIPPKLTRSQATRNFADIQFEREKAKMGVEGAPLRARFDEQNKNLGQNMDAFIDETGAIAPNDRTIGTSAVKAVEQRRDALKANIDAEYEIARANGEMAEPINIRPLLAYIEENKTSAELAPIITSIQRSIDKKSSRAARSQSGSMYGQGSTWNDPLNRTITLNDLENVRQQIYQEIEHGTPGEVKGLAMRDLIDQATEGKGGPAFQQARRSFENYANEFKNRGVISKLLGTKPGTKDRSVAFEDVLDHLTGKGASLDDVRAVRRTLQAAGDDGVQAWKEVQGGLLKKIKRDVYSNISNDETGLANASPAKLNNAVESLDLDGKLDFIYGKQGAQRLRDLNEHSKTILTTPPGSVNFSNSSSAFIAALAADIPIASMTGFPAPVVTALTYGAKGVKSKLLKRKIQSHLDYDPTPIQQPVDAATQAQADKVARNAANIQAQSKLRERVEAARQQKAANISGAQSVDEAIRAFSAPTDQP